MEIGFANDKLRQLCEQDKKMMKELGKKSAKKLKARLADIQAAENVRELRRGRPHPLQGDFDGCLGIELDGGHRLVIESAVQPPPDLEAGGIDWANVTAVRVVFVGDYHD